MKTATKKDFDYFEKRCDFWISFWGLYDWEAEYFFKDMEGKQGKCILITTGRTCDIFLSSAKGMFTDNYPMSYHMDRAAFHEVCHVLLDPLIDQAVSVLQYDTVEPSIEGIIRRLENCVFERLKKS